MYLPVGMADNQVFYACQECSALVKDTKVHDDFHSKIIRTSNLASMLQPIG